MTNGKARRAFTRRRGRPLLLLLAVVATFLLAQLVFTVIEELPNIVEGLK